MAGGPVPEERAERLLARLRAAADADGFLPFDRFQEIALYSSGTGYYDAPGRTLGGAGDFYTAAHASPLFAATLAARVRSEIDRLGRPPRFRVAELGPGDGTLARGLLSTLLSTVSSATELDYLLVERSAALRERAIAALDAPDLRTHVRVAESLSADGPFAGIVIANEVLDAQPTRRLRRTERGWAELGVRWGGERFAEAEAPVARALPLGLPERVEPGTIVEVSPVAEGLVREVADQLEAGAALFLDYGGTEEELVRGHPYGTLQAIRGHQVLHDPYDAPGSADLSAFVNFDRIRAAAARAGLREIAYERQAEALGRWGFEAVLREALASAGGAEAEVRLRLGAKNLLFGFERFRVLELGTVAARSSASPPR